MNNFHPIENMLNSESVYRRENYMEIPSSSSGESPIQSSDSCPEGESSPNDSGISSDITINYISHILMDETDKIDNSHEHTLLEATEKPFYEILGKNYPPSPNYKIAESNNIIINNNWYDYSEGQLPYEFTGNSSFGTTNSFGIDPAWEFNKGVEEGRKFLPGNGKLVIDLDANGLSFDQLYEMEFEQEDRGRKNPHSDDSDLEERRSVKQLSISYEETLSSEVFDEVLLCEEDKFPKSVNDIRETLQYAAITNSRNSGKGRGKKQNKKETVDLHSLLIQCAQMVASSDHRSTNELLEQIRHHSSPTGDGSQRMAHYFANGLEARLAGTGIELYNSYTGVKQRTASDFMKAYKLYLAACPFKKVSHLFSNQTILNLSENATSVHVIDFGINFGFQWPSLIQRISNRPGGPPKLRITGIDVPQPGFRPAERIEETGRRLADYAESFKVPFKYKSIASKWEEIRVEDLLDTNSDDNEVLVVNCLYQMRYLADETVVMDSPRDMVLKTIRKINPNVFIHGIVNGSYNAPYFLKRFREALFHFSSLYDMKDMIVPRGDEVRVLVEREIFGREALNVIACEGLDRVERPTTYKEWQARNLRAGFTQHSVNEDIMREAKEKVNKFYHKEFNVDEHSRWLLQGWKGRTVYALSSWKPN